MATRNYSAQTAYIGWSSMRLVSFNLRTGKEITRHAEDHGSAVGVLPYDPVRKCVCLIKMARAPVILKEEEDIFEVPAGCVDDQEPIAAVKMEALEEVGLQLKNVEFIVRAWSMPAVSTEQIGLYLASYGTSDRVAVGGGRSDEDEEIDVFEVPIAELWELYEKGILSDMKTILLTQALRLRHPELF